jgi:phosphoethanolamine N-methyltransferase
LLATAGLLAATQQVLHMSPSTLPEYNEELLEYLELFRGKGFLSPGGADETRRVLDRVNLENQDVLEIGSGLGGCCLIIAGERGARHVHGLDIEPLVIARAVKAVSQAGLEQQISFELIKPGPLPVATGSFDVIFSKDALCHIENKEALYSELFRVLKPGGQVAIGDWLVQRHGEHSRAMQVFINTTGLSLFMDSLDGVRTKLTSAGFLDVEVVNRNAWFQEEARHEAQLLEGPLAGQVAKLRGQEATKDSNECQQHMIAVLDSGEFCPAHFFARKP